MTGRGPQLPPMRRWRDHSPPQLNDTTQEQPDKPRVECSVRYVRSNFDAGEEFRDINDCRERAQHWSEQPAGMRIHGPTRMRPAVVFSAEEAPALPP
jgi:hypothetical protein